MKNITISILEPGIQRILGTKVRVSVKNGGDFLDAVAELDNDYMKRPVRAKRGESELRSILQFIWDPARDVIFDDVGIESRDKENTWIPLKRDVHASIPDGTSILITPDAGC